MNAPSVVERPFTHKIRRRSEHNITRIEGAVVHAMGESIVLPDGSVHDAWTFLDKSFELLGDFSRNVHCLIETDGLIVECANEGAKCNHAGVSQLGALSNLNWTFLGAELLLAGQWVHTPDFLKEMRSGRVGYTDAQYNSAAWLFATWATEHDFGWDRVVSHSSVSGDDVRGEDLGKLDPGRGWGVGRFQSLWRKWMEELQT